MKTPSTRRTGTRPAGAASADRLPSSFDLPTVAEFVGDVLAVCNPQMPLVLRRFHAHRAARYLPAWLQNPSARNSLRQMCWQTRIRPGQLMRGSLVPEALIKAADVACNPQAGGVRLAEKWITDAKGRKRRNVRPVDLDATDLIRWVVSRAYKTIEQTLAEPQLAEELPDDDGAAVERVTTQAPIFQRQTNDAMLVAGYRRRYEQGLRAAAQTGLQRKIIDLHTRGMAPSVIARHLGKAASTVRTHLLRLRKRSSL